MKQRNSGLELYRVLLMLGIVAYHTITILRPFGRGLDNVFTTCVVGFVLISGWFGIRFSWRKAASLLLTGLYCGLVATILHGMILGSGPFVRIVGLFWFNVRCFWFLWCYLALMTVAPLVDGFVADRKNLKATLPFFLVVFGWSYLSCFPVIGPHVPRPVGFGPTGILTLLAIYCAARMARAWELDHHLKGWRLAVLGFVGSWFGMYHYNSPFALALALSTFVLFSRLKVPEVLGRICAFLAPSMFSVYLIHTTAVGFHVIANTGMCWAVVVLATFSGCVLLDLPRRGMMFVANKIMDAGKHGK